VDEKPNKGEHLLGLAKELLDDIELSRLGAESLLLKATRLARLAGSPEIQKWLQFEMLGYNSDDPVSLEYMSRTGRWTDYKNNYGYWGPLAEQDASIAALKIRLQTLRVPDMNYSASSANPHEVVSFGASAATQAIQKVVDESRSLANAISHISAVRSKVIALLHDFAASIYYEKVFSHLTESLFEQFKGMVDILLAERCGGVLEKVPSVYDRLMEGEPESVSQALNSCRRIIDSFADAVYPPSESTIELDGDGKALQLGPQHHLNRINVYIRDRVFSDSRRKRLRQSLKNIYERVCSGVHSDVTAEEARSLFLETYLLLGEILTLPKPSTPPTKNYKSNPSEIIKEKL